MFGWLEMLHRQMAKGRGGVAWAALAGLHRTPAAGLAWAPQSRQGGFVEGLTTESGQLSPHLINAPWIPGQENRARTLEPVLGTAEGFPIQHSPDSGWPTLKMHTALKNCPPPRVWESELWLSDWRNHRVVAEGTVTLGYQLEF